MAVTQERFDQGMTYDQYKSQMTRNREPFEANERNYSPTAEDLAALRSLPQTVKVLVLAEDWCGDVIANLPILGRLAQETGRLDLRVFLRDQNLDLIDQYLKDGKFRAIPVFAFFNQDLTEIGRFIERPKTVTELRAQKRAEIFRQNPEFGSPSEPVSQLPEETRVRLHEALVQMRDETVPFANAEVTREILQILGCAYVHQGSV